MDELDQLHPLGRRSHPRHPGGAVVAEDREPHAVHPLAAHRRGLPGDALEAEAQRLDHLHRRRVRVVDGRHDPPDLGAVEQRVDHRACGLDGEPAVLRRWRDRVAKRRPAPRSLETDGEIADDLALVLDRHLRPALGIEVVEVRLFREQPLGVRQREGQGPVLEAGDVGIVAVGGEHRSVAGLHDAQQEAVGADRKDGHQTSEADFAPSRRPDRGRTTARRGKMA